MRLRQSRGRPRGQSLVEFALVFPVLMLMVFGLIDGGRLVYAYNTLSNAARDAARVAIVNQTATAPASGTNTCDTTSADAWPQGCGVAAAQALSLSTSDVTVTYTNPLDGSTCVPLANPSCIANLAVGWQVTVTVSTSFQPLTPIAGTVIGSVPLSSSTTMPVERVCSNPTVAPIPHC
jgi:Flp pilus assembly protein TadG